MPVLDIASSRTWSRANWPISYPHHNQPDNIVILLCNSIIRRENGQLTSLHLPAPNVCVISWSNTLSNSDVESISESRFLPTLVLSRGITKFCRILARWNGSDGFPSSWFFIQSRNHGQICSCDGTLSIALDWSSVKARVKWLFLSQSSFDSSYCLLFTWTPVSVHDRGMSAIFFQGCQLPAYLRLYENCHSASRIVQNHNTPPSCRILSVTVRRQRSSFDPTYKIVFLVAVTSIMLPTHSSDIRIGVFSMSVTCRENKIKKKSKLEYLPLTLFIFKDWLSILSPSFKNIHCNAFRLSPFSRPFRISSIAVKASPAMLKALFILFKTNSLYSFIGTVLVPPNKRTWKKGTHSTYLVSDRTHVVSRHWQQQKSQWEREYSRTSFWSGIEKVDWIE